MNPEIKRQLRVCKSLPTLPSVAMEVLQLCQKDDFDMQELSKIIGRDPALTAKILKVANSPLFNLRREVTKVSQAIVWLGVQSVRTLALSFSLVRGLRESKGAGFDHNAYWKRSVVSAVAAGEMARKVGLSSWEEAFLAALLQDIGMIALNQALGEPYAQACADAELHEDLIEAERGLFEGDHAEASAWLAKRWKLPGILTQALEMSHSTDFSAMEGAAGEIRDVARCVAVSGWLAEVFIADDVVGATDAARRRFSAVFGMDHNELDPVLTAIAEQLPDVSSLFDMKIAGAQEIAAILDEARETLVMLNIQNAQRARQAELAVTQLEQRTRQLEENTMKDDLTGLYRRKRLDEFLSHEFDRANFLQKPLSVLFCDIDHFKSVNDNHGHQSGDDILVSVAKLLQTEVRDSDMVARYGGEEFVLVLPGVGDRMACQVAERVRYRIENTNHPLRNRETLQITISVGVATHDANACFSTVDKLVHAADTALYSAKHTGRNRVVNHTGRAAA